MEKHNKNQKAVALSYKKSEKAPIVAAKGEGFVAEKILEVAKKENIPVVKDEKLVNELNKIDLGENIPPELYQVVAEVLVFVSDLDRQEELKRYGK